MLGYVQDFEMANNQKQVKMKKDAGKQNEIITQGHSLRRMNEYRPKPRT